MTSAKALVAAQLLLELGLGVTVVTIEIRKTHDLTWVEADRIVDQAYNLLEAERNPTT
jgi:hypothetical protein